MKHTIGHMGLDPALRDNVQMAYYVAGHMVYYPLDMLKKFTADARGFIQGASSQHVVDKSGSL
jgi:carboxypeptidase C (cathepsin A)